MHTPKKICRATPPALPGCEDVQFSRMTALPACPQCTAPAMIIMATVMRCCIDGLVSSASAARRPRRQLTKMRMPVMHSAFPLIPSRPKRAIPTMRKTVSHVTSNGRVASIAMYEAAVPAETTEVATSSSMVRAAPKMATSLTAEVLSLRDGVASAWAKAGVERIGAHR